MLQKSIVLLLCYTISALSITGYDVMKIVQEESQKKNTREAVVDMKIYDKENRERSRYFNYWVKHKDTREDSLIKFFRPKNVKGTALLTNTDNGADSKLQWIYLPAFKTVKQLSSSDKNKSFMGSDFTYSDIAGRKLSQDDHTLVKEDDAYYYVKSVPKQSQDSIYSFIRYVISKEYRVVIKAIFYDLENKKLKTLTNSSVSVVNDVYVVMKSEMINHQTNGKTLLVVQSMDVGPALVDDLFSIKGLKTQ